MSRNIGPFIDIVRLEDKETKLKTFVRTVVEQTAHCEQAAGQQHTVLLIARSIDSPVAKAVAALLREGTITGPVRCVLALVPHGDADVGETLAALVGTHGGRVVRDARLFDAHEQLVLGPAASWIGDCMRRDPMKRDAYECFAGDCAKTAGWARTSFERLWAICEALPEQLHPAHLPPADACLPTITPDDVPGDPLSSSDR